MKQILFSFLLFFFISSIGRADQKISAEKMPQELKKMLDEVVVSSKRHVYLREEIKSKNMAKRICVTLSPKYFCTSFRLT